jgi:hypothetical protein
VDGRIGWTDLFWSASGRPARTPFLIGCAVLIAVAAIYEAWVGPTLQWVKRLAARLGQSQRGSQIAAAPLSSLSELIVPSWS